MGIWWAFFRPDYLLKGSLQIVDRTGLRGIEVIGKYIENIPADNLFAFAEGSFKVSITYPADHQLRGKNQCQMRQRFENSLKRYGYRG